MDIKEQIEFYRNEINKLEESKRKTKIEDYSYLIGKCFRLSYYSLIKVHSIDYVFQDDLNFHINITCLRIGRHEIDENYSYNLNNSDLEDEMTNEEFLKQFELKIDSIKQKIKNNGH